MKLLSLWGLQLKRKIRKPKKTFIQRILGFLGSRTNLLKRVLISAPLQAITSDITKITYCNGTKLAYLCTFKDYKGQYIYGWNLSKNQTAESVLKAFDKAKNTIRGFIGKISKMIWHSDQGSQYTFYEYIEKILQIGRLSYSKKGTPTDNGGQESFHGRLKEESREEFNDCQTFDELQSLINKKIKYYNKERRHTSINMQIPYKLLTITLNFYTKRGRKGES